MTDLNIDTGKPRPLGFGPGWNHSPFNLWPWLALTIGAFFVIAIVGASLSSSTNKETSRPSDRMLAISATQLLARRFLINGRDAEFPSLGQAVYYGKIDGSPKIRLWAVAGLVNAPNRFGNRVTREYRAFVYRDGENWQGLVFWLEGEGAIWKDTFTLADMARRWETTPDVLTQVLREGINGAIPRLE